MKTKYLELAHMLERRVHAGDYTLAQMPSERRLATELGVSHMTIRRALQHLTETGLIKRNPDQSRTVKPKSLLKIACVVPMFISSSLMQWYKALSSVVASKEGIVRPVCYTSWHDPVILEALDGDFDGIFLLPPFTMPQAMLDRLIKAKHKTVTFTHDLTEHGIPCVDNGRPDAVANLVAHLASLGHRNIALINTQPKSKAIDVRIQGWQDGLAKHNVTGELFDDPVEPMSIADDRAIHLMNKLIEEKKIGPGSPITAAIATTLETGTIILRVMANHGLSVPKDLSLAVCDQVRVAKQMVPSFTTLDTPDPHHYLEKGMDWILSRGQNWEGPILIRPAAVPVWAGESTRKIN